MYISSKFKCQLSFNLHLNLIEVCAIQLRYDNIEWWICFVAELYESVKSFVIWKKKLAIFFFILLLILLSKLKKNVVICLERIWTDNHDQIDVKTNNRILDPW